MSSYDHRAHAGNAGDVWKHFLLVEAADHCLARDLNYAESHVGWPEYALVAPGEWVEGIGRCWRRLTDLQKFLYFRILADLNCRGLKVYPGSARLVFEASRMQGQKLSADIWDIDHDVAFSWGEVATACFREVRFHREDGFSGILALLDRSVDGLLLVDPPHLGAKSSVLAEKVLSKAEDRGWVALLWEMMGEHTSTGCSFEKYELEFERAGLSCGRWTGAVVSMAGADSALRLRLRQSIEEFLKILDPREPFNSRFQMTNGD